MGKSWAEVTVVVIKNIVVIVIVVEEVFGGELLQESADCVLCVIHVGLHAGASRHLDTLLHCFQHALVGIFFSLTTHQQRRTPFKTSGATAATDATLLVARRRWTLSSFGTRRR